jgi:hypothetical protein
MVDSVFPAGRPFAITQSRWFRLEDGRIIEHWASRDDLGLARRLGWIPPAPAYLVKMARAKRQASRRLREPQGSPGSQESLGSLPSPG